MKFRLMLIFLSMILTAPVTGVELLNHTSQSGGEVLRLMRNDKLDLILPGAMRDNNVDMWILIQWLSNLGQLTVTWYSLI